MKYLLKLYTTGKTSNSEKALENLKMLCEEELDGEYEIQLVDLLQKPALAEEEKIIATPTVVKVLPLPMRKVIGDLSQKEKVLFGLDLVPTKKK